MTTARDDLEGSASPGELAAGALLGCFFALGTCEVLLAMRLDRAPLAHVPSVIDYGHVTLGALFMTLSFGAFVVAYRLAAGRLARVFGRPLEGWLGSHVAELVLRALLEVGLPAFLLGWFLMTGTRAWTPNVTLWILLAGALVGSVPAVWALGLVTRWLRKRANAHERAILPFAFVLATTAAVGFAVLSGSFGLRYGKSHLATFGLFVTFCSLVFTEALLARKTPRAGRFWGYAWAACFAVSAGAFTWPPSAAARELFYAERPMRWFGLALAALGADADGDGFSRRLGFTAGQDCDDRDARRNPNQPEIVGNGIDENCFGGDQVRSFRELFADPPALRGRAAPVSNVLVILLDSWRYDSTSPGGVNRELTPAIAALARESLVFTDYRTCSPRTLESFGDLFFGRLVPSFRGASPMSAVARLTSAGIHTVDISSRFRHEHDRVSGWSKEHSIPGAYGRFGDAASVSETQRFLKEGGSEPFFVATHLMGAHEPYEPAKACGERSRPYERYRCALRLLDQHVGAILKTLDDAGLRERTVVAVSADHGEEFGEHGARFHANTVYDEVLHVPLIVRIPGEGNETVREPIGCFDFLPTLLGAANQPRDPQLIGHDFSRGPRPSGRAQLARTRPLSTRGVFEPKSLAVVVSGVKLLVDRQSGLEQYFDLRADPEEKKPLAAVGSNAEHALGQTMDAWLSELAKQSFPDQRTARTER